MSSPGKGKAPESPARSVVPAQTPDSGSSAPNVVAPAGPPVVDFKVWNPPRDDTTSSPIPDVPDSFYEPTNQELQRMYAESQRRLHAMTEGPLLTAKLRNDEEKERKRRERFPRTTIRIKFPDRTMLERTFSSEEKIKSVYKFVRDSLTEEAKPIKFILYQPPGQEYRVSDPEVHDKTLYDLHFSPSSVLFLTFTDPELNHHDIPPPLLPEILAMAKDLPTGPVELEKEVKPQAGGRTLGSASGSGGEAKEKPSAKDLSAEEKKAKLSRLLKLGGKK